MGAGKSTLARRLGARLDWRVEDIDERIEAREGRSVSAIFASQGEPYFRQVERRVLLDLLPLRHVVVATGGGTFADPDNRALINRDGLSVWLDVPLPASSTAFPPTAAGRWPPTARSSSASTTRDAPPISKPTYTSTPATAPSTRWSSNCSTVWRHDRALPGHQRHSRQPRSARHGPHRRRRTLRQGAGAWRPGRLRRRPQRRHRSRARARAAHASSAATTTRSPRASTTARASIRWREAPCCGPTRR